MHQLHIIGYEKPKYDIVMICANIHRNFVSEHEKKLSFYNL